MKRLILILTVLLCCSPLAHADENTRRAKVEQLLTSMHMDRMTDQMMAAARIMGEQAIEKTPGYANMTPEQKQIAAEFQDKVMKLVTDEMGWKAMEPQMVDLYVKNFSDQEIDAILAFYQSPAGQSMIQKMPQLMQQSMMIARERMTELQPKLDALSEEFARQMAAAKRKSPSKPTP